MLGAGGFISEEPASVCQGRLTLESGVPVPSTDQAAKTTLYFTPYTGDKISLWDGAIWTTYTFTQFSIPVGLLASSTNYDVFVYHAGSGVLSLELGSLWTNDTTRSQSLTTQNGVLVKQTDLTRRYVGTIRSGSAGNTFEDTGAKRYVWNYYNRVRRELVMPTEATTSWVYTTATWRQANANAANKVEYVTGDASTVVDVTAVGTVFLSDQGGVAGAQSLGLNLTTGPNSNAVYNAFLNTDIDYGAYWPTITKFVGPIRLGYSAINWIELGTSGVVAFLGAGICGIRGSLQA
jgi:hypothetical protein